MIRFIPLASSSAGCSYVVTAENHAPLLIDAGLPFADLQKRLWSHGVNVSDLAGCLVSHGHLDHCKAVPKLMEAGVNCYAHREAWDSKAMATKYRHHRSIVIQDTLSSRIDKWWVASFHGVHDDPGILGFLVTARGHLENLLYLTDSAYCPHRFEGLTHICVECNYDSDIIKQNVMAGRTNIEVAKRTIQTHSSIDRVLDMLQANDLSKCQEIFLLHLSDSNSNAADFKRQIQEATGVPVYVAGRDGGAE